MYIDNKLPLLKDKVRVVNEGNAICLDIDDKETCHILIKTLVKDYINKNINKFINEHKEEINYYTNHEYYNIYDINKEIRNGKLNRYKYDIYEDLSLKMLSKYTNIIDRDLSSLTNEEIDTFRNYSTDYIHDFQKKMDEEDKDYDYDLIGSLTPETFDNKINSFINQQAENYLSKKINI